MMKCIHDILEQPVAAFMMTPYVHLPGFPLLVSLKIIVETTNALQTRPVRNVRDLKRSSGLACAVAPKIGNLYR